MVQNLPSIGGKLYGSLVLKIITKDDMKDEQGDFMDGCSCEKLVLHHDVKEKKEEKHFLM